MEESGQDLRVLVRLVADYDVSFLLRTLRRVEATEDPEVTVSTAHKSKGLEWAAVRLASDFRVPEEDEDGRSSVDDELAHLLYVAATRARRRLDVSGCPLALYALEGAEHDPAGAPGAPGADPGMGHAMERLTLMARQRGCSGAEFLHL